MVNRALISRHRAHWRCEAILWFAIAGAAALNIVAALRMAVRRDEGMFVAMAAMVAEGAVLYRDLFDRKPPYLFATLATLFRFTDPGFGAARALNLALVAASAIAAYLLARTMLSVLWSACASAVYLFLAPAFGGSWVLTEQPVGLFGTLAVLLIVRKGRPSSLVLAMAGVLIGIAAGYKQVAVLLAGGIGGWLVVDGRSQRRAFITTLREVGVFGVAFALPQAVTYGWYRYIGLFDAMFHCVWLINLWGYPAIDLGEWPVAVLRGQVLRALAVWIPAGWMGLSCLWRFWRRGDGKHAALLAAVVAASLLPSTKRPYQHYVLAYLPALVVLALVGWKRIADLAERRCRSRVFGVVLAAGILASGTVRHYARDIWPELRADAYGQQMAIARRVLGFLRPGEPVYVLGEMPLYYVMTGRYHHWPPMLILPDNRSMVPPTLMYDRLANTPGLRHVLIAHGTLGDLRRAADEIRQRSLLLLRERVEGQETVELYRLPEDWRGVTTSGP